MPEDIAMLLSHLVFCFSFCRKVALSKCLRAAALCCKDKTLRICMTRLCTWKKLEEITKLNVLLSRVWQSDIHNAVKIIHLRNLNSLFNIH